MDALRKSLQETRARLGATVDANNARHEAMLELPFTGKAALREAGVEVKGLLAIFTYGFEVAEAAFAEANCMWSTLTDYSTMLDQAMQEGYITPEQRTLLDSWNSDPQAWSDKFNEQ